MGFFYDLLKLNLFSILCWLGLQQLIVVSDMTQLKKS